MKTKPWECWDNVNVGPSNPQIQNTVTAQEAAESFGHQFEITKDCDIFVMDPDLASDTPQVVRLTVRPTEQLPFEYQALP